MKLNVKQVTIPITPAERAEIMKLEQRATPDMWCPCSRPDIRSCGRCVFEDAARNATPAYEAALQLAEDMLRRIDRRLLDGDDVAWVLAEVKLTLRKLGEGGR